MGQKHSYVEISQSRTAYYIKLVYFLFKQNEIFFVDAIVGFRFMAKYCLVHLVQHYGETEYRW